MGTILISKYKIAHDGMTETGPLIADDGGLYVGIVDHKERVGLFKKRTTYKPGFWVVRWDDATGYEIGKPQQRQLGGSTINANDVILTVKTAASQHAFTLHHTDETRVRNQLGPYLARIDGR